MSAVLVYCDDASHTAEPVARRRAACGGLKRGASRGLLEGFARGACGAISRRDDSRRFAGCTVMCAATDSVAPDG
jgi:hypothetical protein